MIIGNISGNAPSDQSACCVRIYRLWHRAAASMDTKAPTLRTHPNGEEVKSTDSVTTVNTDALPPSQSGKCSKWTVLMITVFLMTILAAGCGYFVYEWRTQQEDGESIGATNDLVDYVFPNTSLVVSVWTNETIQGVFTVNDTRYTFGADLESISFIGESPEQSDPIGFNFSMATQMESNETFSVKTLVSFFDGFGNVYTTEVVRNDTMNETVFDALLQSPVAAHFVELSAKLGAAGYIGTVGIHLQHIHKFALQIYQYEMKAMVFDDLISTEKWDNMTMEFEKVNAIVSASEEAGYWVETMDDLLTYTSGEQSANRRLLLWWSSSSSKPGHCGSPYPACNNGCYGRCGWICDSWDWVCGDGDCYEGCKQHDYYCSCVSFWHPCCLNAAWVSCDGSWYWKVVSGMWYS